MKKNLLILLFIFFIISSCNCNLFEDDDFNNTPLDISDYALYGMLQTEGEFYMTVIDMERDSIIGYQQITREYEFVLSFCLGTDNMIYIPMYYAHFDWDVGNEIRIFDPKEGRITGAIKTEYFPVSISLLPDNKAFLFHYFVKTGDTAMTNSIIDLGGKVVIKKIISYLGNVIDREIFQDFNDDFWVFSNSPVSDDTYIIKYLTSTDTLGERVLLDNDFNGRQFDPSSAIFVSETKLYTQDYPQKGIVVYDFPSGKITDFIELSSGPDDIVLLPNNKVYVSHADYSCTEGTDNYIKVIDTNTDAVIKTIEVCKGPAYMIYSKAMNKVYVGSIHENAIAVIDPNTDTLIKIITGEAKGSVENKYCRLLTNK
ncbi:TPA: hypothetical protein DCW38_01730 [candidate division WOR-3 bacterium]|jgi:YVTN family beta-propeller protein|uniref:YncE family protein n=1 Tax=candidate division WOR-3 bacterium TaxID=2052148 RepID=A0A350H8M0_UNCW3|nr:hypothetical protein [candidate division WOR-3 bacterium]